MSGAAFYIWGNNVDYPLDGYGERLVFRGNYAIGCETLLSARRSAAEMIIEGNFGSELINGIIGSPADSLNNHGRGNRFNKLIGRPIRLYLGKGDIIQGNHAFYGRWLSDNGATYTAVAGFGWISAFELVGCWDSIISGNTGGAREWNMKTGATANAEIHGAIVRDYTSPVGTLPDITVSGRNNRVTNNQFASMYRTTIEATAGAGYNVFEGNGEDDTAAKPSVQAATSTLTRPLLPHGSLTSNPGASIAAGTGFTVDVPVTGAVIGDTVERVSFTRALAGMSWSANVDVAGFVKIRVQNGTGAAVAYGNTEFKAWVRPA